MTKYGHAIRHTGTTNRQAMARMRRREEGANEYEVRSKAQF